MHCPFVWKSESLPYLILNKLNADFPQQNQDVSSALWDKELHFHWTCCSVRKEREGQLGPGCHLPTGLWTAFTTWAQRSFAFAPNHRSPDLWTALHCHTLAQRQREAGGLLLVTWLLCKGFLMESRWRDKGANEVCVLAKCFPSSSRH